MKKRKCLNCNNNDAIFNKTFGWLSCKRCQLKHKSAKVKESIEMVGDEIKTSRKIYRRDTIQPWRGGVLSKEYLKEYGTKGIQVTKEDIKNAKDVWYHENEFYKPD